VSCGARPIAIDHLVNQARAVFELKDGRLVPKPGVMHPRDPCADLDPITWLADLRTGEDGDLLFQKRRRPIDTLTPTSGSGGGAKAPLSNTLNVLHIKTDLNVSHRTPPKK
jgi:hypothetical protein